MKHEDAIREYNSKFRELVQGAWGAEETHEVCFYKLVKDAARHAFNKPRGKGKRRDCDARLRGILNERRHAIMSHDELTTKRPTRNLKKLARQIKLDRLMYELRGNNWEPVKMHKKGYTPEHTKLKDEQGRHVHDRLRAKTFADYYENKHWAIDHDEREDICEEPVLPMNTAGTGETEMMELDEAIKKLKNNKAPGPDEIPVELFKWLDGGSRKVILETLNERWGDEALIKDMNDARLAIIYKKGGTDLPRNCRPIALLNVIYKLLASIIQKRVSSNMDGALDENRFGFRKGRSTAQPLFILRRTQEIQEETALECHLLLLGWGRAFDKVPQDRMTKAIKRPGVPNKLINMINAIYEEPNYTIVDKGTTTDPRIQKAGIRQGCPLSPYLFIMLMTVIMYDVEGFSGNKRDIGERSKLHKLVSGKLFYADDTIIMAKNAEAVEVTLHRIEKGYHKYALELNQKMHSHTNGCDTQITL